MRDLLLFRAERHLGHSPGGGAMVVLLLRAVSRDRGRPGWWSMAAISRPGRLAGMFTKDIGESVEEVHEVLANITLAFIIAHVAAVVFASFAHRENLVRSMVTGYKRPRAERG